MNTNKTFLVSGISIFAVLASIFVVYLIANQNPDSSDSQKTESSQISVAFENNSVANSSAVQSTNTISSVSNSSVVATTKYKNGTYKADIKYTSPAGSESMKMELVIADDQISSINLEAEAENSTSIGHQNRFKSAINSQVVGKKIDELSLSRVAGASLTTGGFNNTLNSIKQTAQY
jgi:hypothetical protein